MRKKPLLFLLLAATAATLACSLTGTSEQKITPAVDEVAAAVKKTLTAVAKAFPTLSPTAFPATATALPVEPTLAQPTAEPVSSPFRAAVVNQDGTLYTWSEAEGMVREIGSGSASLAYVSPDGSRIAFTRTTDNLRYSLWVISSDGTGERVLLDEEQLASMSTSEDSAGAVPYDLQWLADNRTLAFNIRLTFEGPGLIKNDDLWLLNTDSGALEILLPAGAGGDFLFSPDGSRLVVTRPDRIELFDADGSSRSEVLAYTPVITYSEYAYYASPQWSPDSSFLLVAVPPEDPLADPADPTYFYWIPAEGGTAVNMGGLTTSFLSPLAFSPDLQYLVYESEGPAAGDSSYDLQLVHSDLSSVATLGSGNFTMLSWAPDSTRIAFSNRGGSSPMMSALNGNTQPLTDVTNMSRIQWIDANRFLFIYHGTEWELRLGTAGGASSVLLDLGTGDFSPSLGANR